jgi:dolichyl-phosphate-mannose--protein O-mannosyl transferase
VYTLGVCLVLIVACFFYFCPWMYVLPLHMDGVYDRRWMEGWN